MLKMLKTCGGCYWLNLGKPLQPGQHFAVCGSKPAGSRPWVSVDQPACPPATKSTLARDLWDMLDRPTVDTRPICAVCGAPANEQHHPIRRGAGNVYGADGRTARKPTITLCGFGNTSGCHGKAHDGRLHFRFTDRWECLETEEPIDRLTALGLDGWRPL